MKPPFFLQTITVENFKAVHRSGAVKLTPLTVFIGDNGSGKSSLLEGLETYQEVVIRGLDAAMERWLGFEHVWNQRVRHHRKHIGSENETYENLMVFALRGRVFDGSFTVCMEISADPGTSGVRIESESIKLPDGRLVQRDRRGKAHMTYRHFKADFPARPPVSSAGSSTVPPRSSSREVPPAGRCPPLGG